MKRLALDFLRRGLTACGFGPVVLAILYLIFQHQGKVSLLTVNEVCLGILSLSLLAFVAGGTNVVYQIERLPLTVAILIHGGVLYLGYLSTYLVNGWLEPGRSPMLVFTAVFMVVYLVIWAVIFSVTRKNTRKLNEKLKQKQQCDTRSF